MPRPFARAAAILASVSVALTASRVQEPPSLSAVRELRIDGAAHDLTVVSWLEVAPNGTIVAAQEQDYNIRFFSSSGQDLGTVGREGAGPGEFRALTLRGWLGDTLWVADHSTLRITLISPERELARSTPWPRTRDIPAPDGRAPLVLAGMPPWGIYRDGSTLHFAVLGRTMPAWARGGAFMLRLGDSDERPRILAWLPTDPACSVRLDDAPGAPGAPIPYCARNHFTIARDGSRLVFALLGQPSARRPEFGVVVIGAQGDTVVHRRYPYQPVPITARVADSVRAYFADFYGNRPAGEAYRRVYASMKLAETYPPFDRVLAGRDGSIWIERMPTAPQRRWLVLDANGNPIGTVHLPRNIIVQAVARDRFWATERDDNDLESIVRYRLAPARRD